MTLRTRFHAISPTNVASLHNGVDGNCDNVDTFTWAVLPTAYAGPLLLLVAGPPSAWVLAELVLARSWL
ncbi:hypothetical protein D3C71_2102900 [compost metagenome]